MSVQDEHLVLEDELQVPDSDHATATRRGRRWVQPAVIALLVVGLGGAGGMLAVQNSQMDEMRSNGQAQQVQLDELKRTAAELDTALTALGGEDKTVSVASLQGTLDETKTGLTSLDQRVVAAETRLNVICDEKAVSNQQSTLRGQEMTDHYASWQYYSNLSSVMDAICGTESADPD